MAELSFSEIESLVRAALVKAHAGASYAYCRDVYPAAVIYSVEIPSGNSSKTDPGNGVYYKRSFALTEGESGYEVTLGKVETVTTTREYKTVKAFSLTKFSEGEGDYIEYPGTIFEAGDYPDKGVTFTPEDLIAAAAAFTPVDNDLEHRETLLSGKLGSLSDVQAVDNGNRLVGMVRIPKWFHALNKGEDGKPLPIGVSLAYDANKRIVGNALTLSPRIKSAQVAAAFTEFVGKRNSGRDQKDLQQVHDTAVRLGAVCGSEYTAHPPKEKKTPMKLGEFISRLFSGGGNVDLDQEIDTGGAPATTTFANPETDRLKAENAALRAQQLKAEAVKFTDELTRDRRILPAQAEGIQALFVQAAADDATAGVATFSNEGAFTPGDRVKALRSIWTAAPQHSLTKEQLKDAIVVEFAKGDAKPALDLNSIYEGRRAAGGGK